MVTTQSATTIQYDRPNSSVTTSTTLPSEFRKVTSNADTIKYEVYSTLNPDNVAQVDTITITAGVVSDVYAIEVDDGTTARVGAYIQQTGDTAAIIATRLAEVLDLHPGVQATATNNVITLTSLIAGTSIAYDNAQSTTIGNAVIASVDAAVGTPIHRKLADFSVKRTLVTTGSGELKKDYESYQLSVNFYDGANPAVLTTAQGPVSLTSTLDLNTIQVDNGIAQP
jgi:hypothetical protein